VRLRAEIPAFGAALALAACAGGAKDPGPHDLDGWIGQCEAGCDQERSCDPNQLLFDHGDFDNCIRDCSYFLDRDEDRAFVDETSAACLDALYAHVKCVFHLSCSDRSLWETCGEPCADETSAAADACNGIDVGYFLLDCGAPGFGCGEV
jgi:hypothetical protein